MSTIATRSTFAVARSAVNLATTTKPHKSYIRSDRLHRWLNTCGSQTKVKLILTVKRESQVAHVLIHPQSHARIHRTLCANRRQIWCSRKVGLCMLMLNLWNSYQAVCPSFALEKRGGLLARHLFSVKRMTARKWLYHFRLRGRHFDSYAHIMDWTFRGGRFCVPFCIEILYKRTTLVARLTNFSFFIFCAVFTDVSLSLPYLSPKMSKMTRNSNQGVLHYSSRILNTTHNCFVRNAFPSISRQTCTILQGTQIDQRQRQEVLVWRAMSGKLCWPNILVFLTTSNLFDIKF